jgi:LacI family transcriptional regulator
VKPLTEERAQEMATIHDVARLAGVGIGTVSRVMNQSPGVKTATREKVQHAIEHLKYKPDPIARSMILRRTGLMGVIAPFLTRSFCREVLQGMETAAALLGRQLVLYHVQDTAQRDRYFSDLPMYRKVDGLIILSLTPEDADAQAMREVGLPVVLVDAYSPSLSSLVVKTKDGVSRVVNSLLEQGHRRIGWIADPREEDTVWNTANDVFLGPQHLWGGEGFMVEPECLLAEARNREEGRKAAFQLLSRPDRPTAIVTASALQAVGVLEVAQALDIEVPDALSVVGLNEGDIAEWLGLSTIQSPMHEMGEWGVRQLVDRMENPAQSPALFTFEMTFVERRTTMQLAKSWKVSHHYEDVERKRNQQG